jgi:glycosyltransferase involved in cell wall biosynthesis
MIYLSMPTGHCHGWGVCGSYLTRELSALTKVKLFTSPLNRDSVPDGLELQFLAEHAASPLESSQVKGPQPMQVPYPVLQAIAGNDLMPIEPHLVGRQRVGYTFFEENVLPQNAISNAKEHFDVVAAGSSWCERILRENGLDSAVTILQGVDRQIFNPEACEKSYFQDRFVVFSGGKFELRKGQDLALRAFKVLQDKYPDTLLVTSWYNFWQFSVDSMSSSPYIRFRPSSDYRVMMWKTLTENGIDPRRVITLMPQPNSTMASIYKNTDVGLFPNRCEGGTNLVLMEYMACGKPAIASFNTGHQDIINDENAICIRNHKQIDIRRDQKTVAVWDDPDLDETISHLEYAYLHRDGLAGIGHRAGEHMKQFTWQKSAESFYRLLEENRHETGTASHRAA